jgi:hypothetical protein
MRFVGFNRAGLTMTISSAFRRILSASLPAYWLCGHVTAAVVLFEPQCPTSASSVAVVAYQAPPPPGFLLGPAQVVVSGLSVRVVVPITEILTGVPPESSSRQVEIGTLPVGSYQVDLIGRYPDSREVALASRSLRVTQTPLCGPPTLLDATSGAVQSTGPSGLLSQSLEVSLVDEQGRPIEGELIQLQRLSTLEEALDLTLPRPDIQLMEASVVTDAQGTARFSGVAGPAVGTVQYRASYSRPGKESGAYFVISIRPNGSQQSVQPVVEYYNPTLAHYFLTTNLDEMKRLDRGDLEGWIRTGFAFLGFPVGASMGNRVCRYYGLPSAGIDSHFFSASEEECDAVAARFPNTWLLETREAFRIALPNQTNGACDAAAVPVYRVYNQRADVNHRYTTGLLTSRAMVNGGWLSEGYGNDGVIMCAPR